MTLVACGAVGFAGAATVEYETVFKKFEVEPGGGDVKGKLDSRKGKCMKNRKVKASRNYKGHKRKLRSDKTNKKGQVEAEPRHAQGRHVPRQGHREGDRAEQRRRGPGVRQRDVREDRRQLSGGPTTP